MAKGKYNNFSSRLVEAMKMNGYTASRSPSGICIKTLSEFAGASEQICRRYIRGDALPDYEKVVNLATFLKVSPGWLLFGEGDQRVSAPKAKTVDDDLMHYILNKSHRLYREEQGNTDDYADFVLGLIREIREIDTSRENLEKLINFAMSSISTYKEKRKAYAG